MCKKNVEIKNLQPKNTTIFKEFGGYEYSTCLALKGVVAMRLWEMVIRKG